MATATATANPKPTRGKSRGKGGNRGRGRGGHSAGNVRQPVANPEDTQSKEPIVADGGDTAQDADGDIPVCWICAEPVKYYAVSECNHRTCHVCALRLRALYKKTDCTFCKEPQPVVAFTASPDAPFSSLSAEPAQYKDEKLSILFESQEMMEETLILLRFNCPDPDCDSIAKGWADLKLHVRASHSKMICDICIRAKKVFSHEHALYTYPQLCAHVPSINMRGHHKAVPKEQIEGGIHPLCEFCRECFFDGDELYAHMRERHEECFVCKRNGVRDQYFQDYPHLEKHFHTAHHPCAQSSCLAQKFVVFATTLDLQAHMVEEHGADMSSRDKKDARRIQAEFEFEEVGVGGRRPRPQREREREREPPHRTQQQPPPPGPSAPRPTPAVSRRREAFGSSLTNEDASATRPASTTPVPTPPNATSRIGTPAPPRTDVDPAVLERHSAFLARLQSFASNPTTAVPAVKAAIRGYRAAESSARDLITTIWNVLDCHLDHTASIVNAFVDLLEEEDKKTDLLGSWKGFELEQKRQFPELVPTALGSGYSGITSGRVLNAKNSTAPRSSQPSRQLWDRVARAANSTVPGASGPSSSTRAQTVTSSFPVLNAAPAAAGPAFRQPQRNTPWSSSSAAAPRPAPVKPAQAPPKLSKALFPELPSSTNTRANVPISGNVSLKNILGNAAPAMSAWSAGGSNGGTPAEPVEGAEGAEVAVVGGKGKKNKGKQKQTLFTSSFTPI